MELAKRIRRVLNEWIQDPSPGVNDHDARAVAVAVLLLEVAWADHELAAIELASIAQALGRLYGLTDTNSAAVLESAMKHHREGVSVQPFTRNLCERLSAEERIEVVIELWQVALLDQGAHKYEEHQIRKVADLLYVAHGDFIRAKLIARERTGQVPT